MKKNLKFEEKYEILIKYYNQHGNINIKQKEIYNNYPVGKWLANFRDAYKNNKLPKEQIEKLNKLNMIWENLKQVSSISLFNKKYEILKAYYEEHGNLNISTKQVYNSFSVGDYVKQFRDSYRKQGNFTPLTKEQIKLLDEIDMVWNPKQEKEIIKEEVPSYFIKKYKNKSSKQIITLYKYLTDIVKEEDLLNELRRIFKTNEVKALYKNAYYLYKNIFDTLRISEKEYLNLLNENFSLNSLIIENECKPIEQNHLDHIFEAFYRAEFDRNKNTGGNGLGLYIVQQILKTLNISHSFESVQNGMKFTINFEENNLIC